MFSVVAPPCACALQPAAENTKRAAISEARRVLKLFLCTIFLTVLVFSAKNLFRSKNLTVMRTVINLGEYAPSHHFSYFAKTSLPLHPAHRFDKWMTPFRTSEDSLDTCDCKDVSNFHSPSRENNSGSYSSK